MPGGMPWDVEDENSSPSSSEARPHRRPRVFQPPRAFARAPDQRRARLSRRRAARRHRRGRHDDVSQGSRRAAAPRRQAPPARDRHRPDRRRQRRADRRDRGSSRCSCPGRPGSAERRACASVRMAPAANWPRRRGGGYAFHMASQAIDLDAWLAGPLGGMLIEQERAIVARLARMRVRAPLPAGRAPGARPTPSCPARARAARRSYRSRPLPGAALVAEPAALSLQSDSVDVMLLAAHARICAGPA